MKSMKITLVLLAAMLALFTVAVIAGDASAFEELDRDSDGYISEAEAGALPCLSENYLLAERESELGLNPSEYESAWSRFCSG